MDKISRFQDQENGQAPQLQQEEQDEQEEALSLCDLPLNSDETDNPKTRDNLSRTGSASQPSFEFFNVNLVSNDDLSMSHAEDIIHRGKLVPYAYNNNNRNPFDDRILESHYEDALNLSSRRYCDSLPTRSNNSSTRLSAWSSRSLDGGRKIRRNSSLVMKSEAAETRRSFSKGSRSSKPRWYILMFGSVKVPRVMDLRDMKSRQVRRSPGSRFTAAAEGGGSDRRSSPWGHSLMRVLSCRNHASVDVMASSSLGLEQQV